MKQLTIEEEIACRDHLDAIVEIAGGIKLSIMLDTLKQQMKLSPEDERLIFGMIQKTINDAIFSSFAQTGEQIKNMLNNPVIQADVREKINAMHTPKGGGEVEIPTE
jgi:hypothetical protein